ncbi:nuclear factor 7, ovary isoform X2 [Danio aesculapii]|uniref:nuclear factor 7, ovary isoform X2 n=1 Tax=Danio aesculapii TaxID=1142201 RepID=UPI0024C01151|nr:nuclear factor 7, ovary isoform X2 [Danio aesculapii]
MAETPNYSLGRRDSIDLPPFMGLSKSLHLTEDCQCPVCLDVFTDPVTTPCGHNFCKACLKQCWDNSQDYRCPLCKETSSKRPEVKSNTVLREIVQLFMESTKEDPLCTGGPLSEELQCSVCLDVFNDPVTTPCGHNYCKTCLEKCWDYNHDCICPYCKETFSNRPDLKCNTALREIVQLYEKNTDYKREPMETKYSKPFGTVQEEPLCKPSGMACSCCVLTENPACFICLESLIDPVWTPCGHSFCKACIKECWEISHDSRCPCCKERFTERETSLLEQLLSHSECFYHVENVATIKKVMMTDLVEEINPKMIQKHDRALEMFGGDDCVEGDHKTNNTLSAEDESEKKKDTNPKIIQKHGVLQMFSGEDQTFEHRFDHKIHKAVPVKDENKEKVKIQELVQQMMEGTGKRNSLKGVKSSEIKSTKNNVKEAADDIELCADLNDSTERCQMMLSECWMKTSG